MQALDRGGDRALVEAGFLYRRAGQQSTIAAGNQVDFWGADNVLEQISRGHDEA